MRKKTLDLSALQAVVLDEADEMLRMGFVEDVEWVMEQTPENRQVALFSATMPPRIRRIAQKHLKAPVEVSLENRSSAATTITQYYCAVPPRYKTEALMRIMELEETDGIIVFTRTKSDTVALTEVLVKAGYRAAALNGDLAQAQRERTVGQLKKGALDILVATDVAARGLDVERISHVINYDPPHDAEAYVHRIGRTGRAGRPGKAILLLYPRDRRVLRYVEQSTRQRIAEMSLPSTKALNRARIAQFSRQIDETLKTEATDTYRDIITKIVDERDDCSPLDVAVALATMLRSDRPLLLEDLPTYKLSGRNEKMAPARQRNAQTSGHSDSPRIGDENLERFRVQVGASHGMNASHLVGAIANEADLSSKYIGKIEIYKVHSTVDLPIGMPEETLQLLKAVRVCNRPLKIRRSVSQNDTKPAVNRHAPRNKRNRPPAPRKGHVSRKQRPHAGMVNA